MPSLDTLSFSGDPNWVFGKEIVVGLLAIGLVVVLIQQAYSTNFQKIDGIPEVGNSLPFIGHLKSLGGRLQKNDSTVFTEWSKQVSSDIIQVRMGNQRSVIVSSWALMKQLWVLQSNSLIDKPAQPGFVEKLGVDITGSSMTDQIRRCRQAAMKALGKPMWPKYYHLVEPSSVGFIRSMYRNGQNGKLPLDAYYFLRHISFDLALSLTYGARFGEVNDAFMTKFLASINAISAVRSSTKSFKHFVPLLRVLPERTSATIQAEQVRAKHVDILYTSYQRRVAAGETVDCIVSSLGEDKLSEDEIHGTCISLLQAAPDTVASGVYQGLAWLSTPQGRPLQKEAYEAILAAYDGDRDVAWRMAFREEKVPLMVSFYKETLRFFTVTPYATPRRTAKEVKYNGSTMIPKGVTMILNAQEVNHDTAHFGPDAWEFNPYRYLGNDTPLPHVTFGVGSRICPAVGISNRLMYALLVRLVLAFEVREPEGREGRKPNVDPVGFSDVYDQLVAHPKFFDTHFTARDPVWLERVVA